MHEQRFWRMLDDEELAFTFCINNFLIPSTRICCNNEMTLRQRFNTKNKTAYFRCTSYNCRKEINVRKNTFFEGSHLRLGQILMIMFNFSRNTTDMNELKLKTGIKSYSTIVDWLSFCREICELWIENHPAILGGVGHIVELDEAVLVKRKYNRGRPVNECWVFCGVDVQTKEAFAFRVQDRREETLYPIILQHVILGTRIYTDGARVYQGLRNLGYEHFTCNHSIGEWVNSETGATVNHVESFWQKMKTVNKVRYGTHRSTIDSHICEHIWHKKFKKSIEMFITHVVELYPLDNLS